MRQLKFLAVCLLFLVGFVIGSPPPVEASPYHADSVSAQPVILFNISETQAPLVFKSDTIPKSYDTYLSYLTISNSANLVSPAKHDLSIAEIAVRKHGPDAIPKRLKGSDYNRCYTFTPVYTAEFNRTKHYLIANSKVSLCSC